MGGQFAPASPGHFAPVRGGQFQPAALVNLLRSGVVTFTGFSTLTKENKKILINSNLDWKHFKPEYEISKNGELISLRCNSEKEAKEILNGLARKYPKIIVEESLKNLKVVDEYLSDRVFFDHLTIGGKKSHRAIAKIAVNYFLFKGGEKSLIQDVIDYVCLKDMRNLYVTFYYSFAPIHMLEKDEISHILYLRGDNRKQLLYCYIELFSTLSFIVILNRNYSGENFTNYYCYDIIKDKEIRDKRINLCLLYDLFERLKYQKNLDKYLANTQEYIKIRETRALAILENLETN